MGLIYLQGGPLDGNAYETKTLLGPESLQIPILEYVWTSEKKTSEKTNATAQVWKHQSIVEGVTPAHNGRAATAPVVPQLIPTGAVFREMQEATAEHRANETATQVEDPNASTPDSVSTAVDPATVTSDLTGTNEPATTVEPVQPAPTAISELPSGAELLELRKTLKLSRGDVVDRCGLAHSKIASIEAGTGKRVKPEEIQLLATTLEQFKIERGGAGARS